MSEIQKNQLPCNLQSSNTAESCLELLSKELDETLALGKHLPVGTLYLFFYCNQFAIATCEGLASWPEGPKQMIDYISMQERIMGLSDDKKKRIIKTAFSILISQSNENDTKAA
jgi:hypothetical protein